MSKNPNEKRQPKGTSVGGQYAPSVNPEATVDLGAVTPPDNHANFMQERVEALRSHGFVPATTAPMMVDARSSAHVKEWWDTHMAAGEFNHPEGGYAQMPDDWTPRKTLGASSISGLRRTRRMAYVGNEVAIRMPSATSMQQHGTAASFYRLTSLTR